MVSILTLYPQLMNRRKVFSWNKTCKLSLSEQQWIHYILWEN